MIEKLTHVVTQEDIDNNPDLGLTLGEEVTLAKKITASGANKGAIFLAEEEEEGAEESESAKKDSKKSKQAVNRYYKGALIKGDIVDVDISGTTYKQFMTENGVSYKINVNEAADAITSEAPETL